MRVWEEEIRGAGSQKIHNGGGHRMRLSKLVGLNDHPWRPSEPGGEPAAHQRGYSHPVRAQVAYCGPMLPLAPLRERAGGAGRERRRFGRRRLLTFLRREGFVVNNKRLFRLDREERLMVRRRRGRNRALGTRTPMPVPARGRTWVPDFVADQLVSGRGSRILAIYDVCTCRCLVAICDFSLLGNPVAREHDRLIAYVLGLSHALNISFFTALARSGEAAPRWAAARW